MRVPRIELAERSDRVAVRPMGVPDSHFGEGVKRGMIAIADFPCLLGFREVLSQAKRGVDAAGMAVSVLGKILDQFGGHSGLLSS